ncbi:hypothetical protein GOV04_04770 [Candidatus Woesearchaeota archaeon]|nr:hypothetical protein [Candidatus Woesearchaeota archaeon]
MLLVELNKANLQLSIDEFLAFTKIQKYELLENFLLVDNNLKLDGLALTKKAYQVVDRGRLKKIGSKEFFVRDFWTNTERFEDRRSHLRPQPHPTSLHPRLARAVVNLAGVKGLIADPFCGAAGLLLEAGLAGHEVYGIDSDVIQTRRAKINLAHYNIKDFEIVHGNALDLNKQVAAIVTDVPYGRNTNVKDLKALIKDFLVVAAKNTKVLVLMLPSDIKLDFDDWKVQGTYEWYLHKSLTKKIVRLEKK